MDPVLRSLNFAPIILKLARVVPEAMRVLPEIVMEQARLMISSTGKTPGMLQLIPPAHAGVKGEAARRAGEMAIWTDLRGGTRSKGFRDQTAGIFTVISASTLARNARKCKGSINVRLFVKKDGTVYGTDTMHYRPHASISEMRAHHRRYFKNGRMTRAAGNTKDIGRWKFIDQMVVSDQAFRRYFDHIRKHVGIMASSFNAAAQGLGAKGVPKYALNHGSKFSSYQVSTTATAFWIHMHARLNFGIEEIDRRWAYALQYRLNAMDKRGFITRIQKVFLAPVTTPLTA